MSRIAIRQRGCVLTAGPTWPEPGHPKIGKRIPGAPCLCYIVLAVRRPVLMIDGPFEAQHRTVDSVDVLDHGLDFDLFHVDVLWFADIVFHLTLEQDRMGLRIHAKL